MDFNNLRTIRQLTEEAKARDPNTFLTEGKLRWWIHNADTNGIKVAIVRVGGRIFLDRDALNKWLESLKEAQSPNQPQVQELSYEGK